MKKDGKECFPVQDFSPPGHGGMILYDLIADCELQKPDLFLPSMGKPLKKVSESM